MDEIIKAIADHDGRTVNWSLVSPLDMVDDMSGMCNATDEFLLDHPGCRVTIVVERGPLPAPESGV
jgi:hypothetical protein